MQGTSDKQRQQIRLDSQSAVPVYRQIMDQISAAIASGSFRTGHQLPTVRQLAVDLSVNPNTVIRAYRELEMRGLVDTQQGSGTFVSSPPTLPEKHERERLLREIVTDFVARAGSAGFTVHDLYRAVLAAYPDAATAQTFDMKEKTE